MRALKMRSIVASHWNLTMKNWEQLLKLILLLLHKKLPKNSMSTILWLFSIWSKLERWKTLISGCLMSWPKLLKKSSFWSVVFSYSMQQQQFIWPQSCYLTYSTEVGQEVLQRRLEPWRWGVQWPAIESWLRPIERLIEADPIKTAPEIAKELSVNHSTVL